MPPSTDIIYVGRSRLHRMRANAIQTLHTTAALTRLGRRVELWLPPWPRSLGVRAILDSLAIDIDLDVRRSHLLHPRWGYGPFVRVHRRRLAGASVRYCREPRIGLALAGSGLEAHQEIHDVRKLEAEGLLERVIRAHRAGGLATLIPISRSGGALLVEAGADPSRVHVAPSGVDVEAYAGIESFDPDRLDEPRIVHLGRVSADRGAHVFEGLARRGGCTITLVGRQEDDVTGPGVTIAPAVPPRDVPDWYARCDIVVLPYQPTLSTVESMSPVKLFEAMASGRPILVSDLGVVREVIEHERNGLLVEPENVDAWVDALARLRQDRPLAERIAAQARRDAAKFSWRSRAAGILTAIR